MSQTVQVKQYKCFKCGEPIIFTGKYYKNAKGKSVPQPFNPNGTEHTCDKSKEQNYKNSEEYKQDSQNRDKKRASNYWKYFWAYGRGATYKKYDSTGNKEQQKEKQERRKRAKQQREEYKQQYYNSSLTIDKALEILEIVKVELLKLSKDKIFTEIKNAYRKMVLKVHPDRHPQANEQQKKEFSEQFRQVTEAYELLEKERFNL